MIALFLGLIISIVHYFSETICFKYKKHYLRLISFSTGVSVTYLFLDLFPRFSIGASKISEFLFIFVMIGFIMFTLVEKYIYQHAPKDKLLRDLALEDSSISFIYHFVVGIILVQFLKEDLLRGLLLFIPIVLYTAIGSLPVDASKYKLINIILSLSTFMGIIFAKYIYTDISPGLFYSMLGFIIGSLSFTVIKKWMPKDKHVNAIYFIIGSVLYALILFFLR